MMYIPQIAYDNAKLAESREDYENNTNLPRGNCSECGKQFKTPKDTKSTWYWLGYQMGYLVMQSMYENKMKELKEILGERNE